MQVSSFQGGGMGLYYSLSLKKGAAQDSAAQDAEPEMAEPMEGTGDMTVAVQEASGGEADSGIVSMQEIWRELNIYSRLTEMLRDLTPEPEESTANNGEEMEEQESWLRESA